MGRSTRSAASPRRAPIASLCGIAMLCLLAIVGCSAPQPMTAPAAPAMSTPALPSAPSKPAARAVASAPTSAPRSAPAPRIDASCRVASDCAIKDVGSCCGAQPACVNANSPTDPAAVQAACKASGKTSTCGYRQIASCRCESGTCRAVGEPVGGWTDGPQTVPLK